MKNVIIGLNINENKLSLSRYFKFDINEYKKITWEKHFMSDYLLLFY